MCGLDSGFLKCEQKWITRLLELVAEKSWREKYYNSEVLKRFEMNKQTLVQYRIKVGTKSYGRMII